MMKPLLAVLVLVSVASGQDGSYILDSRGVEAQQGLLPSRHLYDNYEAFSDAFRQRSQQMATEYSLDQTIYNDPNPEYTWAYAVDAKSTGDMKSAREERRGDVVVGQYSVVDPDGTLRTVDYSVAPGTGFQATVTKERADDLSSSPVKYHRELQHSQSDGKQTNRYQQQPQQSFMNQIEETRSLNHQTYSNDFANQGNSRSDYQNQFQNHQYQYENEGRFYNQQSNRNQIQNQQYNKQSSQNQNENYVNFKKNNDNYIANQRYGYTRNDFNNNQYNSQRSLYSRDGQNSQSYARVNGYTNRQNYNQYNSNYNNQQAQFRGRENYNQYQQNRDSKTYTSDQFRRNYYNTQQEQSRKYNPTTQYRDSQYNQNQYDNQYYQIQQRNNERQQYNETILGRNLSYNSPNYYQGKQYNQGNPSRRSQHRGEGQYRGNRYSQNHQSRLTNQYSGQNSQFYSHQRFQNQNQNTKRNYSPISVVLA
ncbi:GATA zinc finger domain-containing protein 14-like isoform X1 [Palaemon carinicauda]|uniref:GATA zinc finger domain-containing protein 14-like isoform X1 n=2 Tax=Palaemon carinicauda TaxID=392227 RepID=UPI0035B6194B